MYASIVIRAIDRSVPINAFVPMLVGRLLPALGGLLPLLEPVSVGGSAASFMRQGGISIRVLLVSSMLTVIAVSSGNKEYEDLWIRKQN